MKKVIAFLVAIVGAYLAYEQPLSGDRDSAARQAEPSLATAIRERRENYQVQGSGTVVRLLADDREGSRHQRFIVRLDSGETLLIAHNIDLAPRIDSLEVGRTVSFFGEYEWNERGGVIHWTHHDPRGQHVGGWLEYDGRRYQ